MPSGRGGGCNTYSKATISLHHYKRRRNLWRRQAFKLFVLRTFKTLSCKGRPFHTKIQVYPDIALLRAAACDHSPNIASYHKLFSSTCTSPLPLNPINPSHHSRHSQRYALKALTLHFCNLHSPGSSTVVASLTMGCTRTSICPSTAAEPTTA